MIDTSKPTDLTGKILIAMPSIGDARFEHSVIYMCTHSEEGAMGLIVNKPMPNLNMVQLFDQLDIDVMDETIAEAPVFFGGPVERTRGFVLHKGALEDEDAEAMELEDGLYLSATRDVLEALAEGRGPEAAVLALGYTGWGPGQLEDEIQQNGWLTVEADEALLFDLDVDPKWQNAMAKTGIDPRLLADAQGSA
ncbi:MAG: YqgE/AlgH family protein [Halocynthiibacter sp.]